MIFDSDVYLTDDERLAERLAETPAQRRERVANRVVDAETTAALRRLWRLSSTKED